MKWSELPKEYRDLEIPEDAKAGWGLNFNSDIIAEKFAWDQTNEGYDFWRLCHNARKIDELPPLKEKVFGEIISEEEKEDIFYMIYVDGASGSTRKHNLQSATEEANRLAKETDRKVFILKSEYCLQRNVQIKLIPFKKY